MVRNADEFELPSEGDEVSIWLFFARHGSENRLAAPKLMELLVL